MLICVSSVRRASVPRTFKYLLFQGSKQRKFNKKNIQNNKTNKTKQSYAYFYFMTTKFFCCAQYVDKLKSISHGKKLKIDEITSNEFSLATSRPPPRIGGPFSVAVGLLPGFRALNSVCSFPLAFSLNIVYIFLLSISLYELRSGFLNHY